MSTVKGFVALTKIIVADIKLRKIQLFDNFVIQKNQLFPFGKVHNILLLVLAESCIHILSNLPFLNFFYALLTAGKQAALRVKIIDIGFQCGKLLEIAVFFDCQDALQF